MNKLRHFILFVLLSTSIFYTAPARADFTPFTLGPNLFKQATVGTPYSLSLQVSGGSGPYVWSVTSGTLPNGLTLDASTGVVSGIPTTAEADSILIQVQDFTGAVASKQYDLAVYPSVGGLTYSRTPSGSTVSNPLNIHIKGVFGADICDNRSTGMIVEVLPSNYPGSPSIDQNIGFAQGTAIDQDFSFTLPLGTYKGVDIYCLGNGVGGTRTLESGNFSVFAIGPSLFKQSTVGDPYTLTLQVSGGSAPYTWSITEGALATGLTLDTSTGVVSGIPTTKGSFPVLIQAQDATGATTTKLFNFATYSSAGGLSYTRTPSGSSIPSSTTLHIKGVFGADICDNRSSRMIIEFLSTSPGTPAPSLLVGAGQGELIDQDFNFTLPLGSYSGVQLTCSGNGVGGTRVLESGNFTVFAMGPNLFRQATVGNPYSLSLQVSGGSAPYTWSVINGTLPSGLTLDASSGVVSGIPTTIGQFPVTAMVEDSTGATASKQYDLAVYPSVGGLLYSRTPSGSSVPSNISIHLKGVFGADICDNRSTGVILEVLNAAPATPSLSQNLFGLSSGTVIDQVFVFNLPLGTYKAVQLTCSGNGVGGTRVLENGDFSISTNQPPVLSPIGNKTVNEGQNLSFTVSATDPNGDTLTYTATNLPAGATFNPTTHVFSWTPNYGQAGNYNNVEFTVSDNGTPMMLALEDITITVGHVNRAPVFAPVGPQQVLEHNPLSFTVSATDPDSDPVTLSATGLPSGATFNSSTGAFAWTPGHPQVGNYVVTFKATDSYSASSTLDVVITVGTNPTPSEQAQALIDAVVAAHLPNNITNSYLANLNKVSIFIDQGKVQPAINQLNAFIQKVNTDYSQGKIPLAQKNDFVSRAQAIIAAL